MTFNYMNVTSKDKVHNEMRLRKMLKIIRGRRGKATKRYVVRYLEGIAALLFEDKGYGYLCQGNAPCKQGNDNGKKELKAKIKEHSTI